MASRGSGADPETTPFTDPTFEVLMSGCWLSPMIMVGTTGKRFGSCWLIAARYVVGAGLRNQDDRPAVHVVDVDVHVESVDDEETMLTSDDPKASFHVLVCTPKKLKLVIRNRKVEHRPLALAVMDEAQNIEDKSTGCGLNSCSPQFAGNAPRPTSCC